MEGDSRHINKMNLLPDFHEYNIIYSFVFVCIRNSSEFNCNIDKQVGVTEFTFM